MTDPRQPPSRPGGRERRATLAVFLVAGLGLAAWAPLVPYAQARLGVDAATLGLLLLCLGAGSIIAMPPAGGLTARFGCRRVIWAAGLGLGGALPALATAPTVPLLALALLGFGAAIGTLDVAVNVQAVIVETRGGRAMMSGFHGLFSAGGVLGAGGLSALLDAGASPLAGTLVIGAAILALLLASDRHLLRAGGRRDAPLFALPRGAVLAVGGLVFVAFLAEGAMLDWSAVFLTSRHAMDATHAGAGYAVFSVAMTGGRLLGDRLVQALGGRAVLAGGALGAAAGLALATLGPSASVALAGFAVVGVGAANIVPVLYSALGRQHDMPPGLAVAAVTALGYSGILIGPALIGVAAAAASLSTALLGIAALLVGVAAGARIAVR